jgi:Mor family transcriptional regulator
MLDKQQINQLPEQYRPPIEELPGDMQAIAQAMEEDFPGLGVRIVLALAQRFPGQWVYVRKMDGPLLAWRNDCIRAMYDQGNITGRELSRFWRLSQSSIEKILAQPSPSQKALEEKQMKLF